MKLPIVAACAAIAIAGCSSTPNVVTPAPTRVPPAKPDVASSGDEAPEIPAAPARSPGLIRYFDPGLAPPDDPALPFDR